MLADLLFFAKAFGIIMLIFFVVAVIGCAKSSGMYSRKREQQELCDEMIAWQKDNQETEEMTYNGSDCSRNGCTGMSRMAGI